jgi:plastocyanin
LLITGAALPARAEGENPASAAAAPTRAEFDKLQTEVREQRQLIIQMLQNEQQRYDMLLRLMQGQPGAAALPPASAAATALNPLAAHEAAEADGKHGRAPVESERKTASVEGKVTLPAGEVGPVYVYIDGIRMNPVRGKSIEIRQEARQFSPQVAVVQPGTSVLFPNLDSVFHNVFSSSPRNSFDLGSYRAGEKPRAVTLTSPGVVEVFCNIHQKMNAKILVVPNAYFTQVRPNGSFRLNGVPIGQRSIVAWSPHAKPTQQKVEVTGAGAQVSFVLERQDAKAHVNKLGQAYGSYRD